MPADISFGLLAVGVGLGLRHGIDWDHIAAITDVTSAQPSRQRSLLMGTLYAGGHALVVVVLGLLAIWSVTKLPAWVDGYMETIVGITLVTLGIWVFYSLIRNPNQFRLKSRWMLLFSGIRSFVNWTKAKIRRTVYTPSVATSRYYGAGASAGIGMIHGIGAETGSQALVLATAAGATSALAGSFLLLSFTVGLLISNSLITLASTLGLLSSQSHKYIYIGLGILIGSFSLIVGTLFLFRKGDLLPGFFA